jgi:flagellar basal body P-ring protein FlgI
MFFSNGEKTRLDRFWANVYSPALLSSFPSDTRGHLAFCKRDGIAMRPSKTLVWILMLALIGCQQLSLRSQAPEDDETPEETLETTVHTPLIGERTTIAGLHMITIHGYGLVTGLDGTGGDPPTSIHRTMLLEDMRKRQVRNPNQILQSPNTALVLIKAYLPPLIAKGEKFDVEVYLPGNSTATSLSGGYLLDAYLTEQAMVPGQGLLKGHEFAIAKGPILVSPNDPGDESLAGVLQRGRILGGGTSKKDRNLELYLRNDYATVRNSQRIADRIASRFHHYNKHGLKESLAKASTDRKIELQLHPRYKENFPRYLQVIRNMSLNETPVAARVRMQKLKQQLNNPETSEIAALQLEAIGPDSIPILKSGLKNDDIEVRFNAAVAMAYLGDSDGLPALIEVVRKEPAFRVFALAAIAALDDVEAHFELRDLMSEKSIETRYGAFRALWTLDRNDAFIRGERLNDEFMLHTLHTTGDPLIHLTHHQRAEIVLFGADQRLRTPIAVRAGKNILVTGNAGADTLRVSCFQAGMPDQTADVSNRVADVIRTAAKFGASYPDVVQMLMQCDRQRNTTASIAVDSLPQAGRVYVRRGDGPAANKRARIGQPTAVPNMFPDLKEDGRRDAASEETAAAATNPAGASGSGTASLVDASASAPGAGPFQEAAEDADRRPEKSKGARRKDSKLLNFLK